MIDVKLQLLMRIVFPVLLYTQQKHDLQINRMKIRLLAFEMRCYRRILMKRYEQLYNEKKQWWIQSE